MYIDHMETFWVFGSQCRSCDTVVCCGSINCLIVNDLFITVINVLLLMSCHVPAEWGIQQTTRARGSDKTRGRGTFGPFTGGLNLKYLDKANLAILPKNLKEKERTIHQTRFTKTGWTWHVRVYIWQKHLSIDILSVLSYISSLCQDLKLFRIRS